MSTAIADEFHRLHAAGCFVMPNAWDAGSARALASLGFPAIASTSSGFAWSRAMRDGAPSMEDTLGHFRVLSESATVPVNGDFLNGFGADVQQTYDNYLLAATTGVAGLSIEDASGNPARPVFQFADALERVRAARRAIDDSRTHIVLTARAEAFLYDDPDLGDVISRLVAFADAGADCLYAPGLANIEHVRTVVDALRPKAVNVLVWKGLESVSQLEDAGVRRISTGGAMARAAWTGFLGAASALRDKGSFEALLRTQSGSSIEKLLDG